MDVLEDLMDLFGTVVVIVGLGYFLAHIALLVTR